VLQLILQYVTVTMTNIITDPKHTEGLTGLTDFPTDTNVGKHAKICLWLSLPPQNVYSYQVEDQYG